VAAGYEGGSWDGVRKRWTFVRYKSMIDHWAEQGPPVYVSVAAYLGFSGKKAEPPVKVVDGKPVKTTTSTKTGDLNQLASMFAKSGGNF
jgi:hypothetical protein